jgi:hypothetical protein
MEQIYSSKDVGLASTLITLGFKMNSISYQYEGIRPHPVGYFEFVDSPELQKALSDYWRGELLVEPRNFMTNLRGLKAEISNVYKNPNINADKS